MFVLFIGAGISVGTTKCKLQRARGCVAAGSIDDLPLLPRAVCVCICVDAYGVFINPLADEFGWSRAEINIGLSVGLVMSALAAPPLGYVLDRWGSTYGFFGRYGCPPPHRCCSPRDTKRSRVPPLPVLRFSWFLILCYTLIGLGLVVRGYAQNKTYVEASMAFRRRRGSSPAASCCS